MRKMDEESGRRQILIRNAVREDAAAIAELADQLGYPSQAADVAECLEKLMELEDHAVFVAQADEAGVVGWVHVRGAYHLMMSLGSCTWICAHAGEQQYRQARRARFL
jgi:bacterioferritin-associated ferredoxin